MTRSHSKNGLLSIFESLQTRIGILLLLTIYFQALPVRGEPSGLDLDGDGIADAVGYEIQHDGSPNEIALTYIPSTTGVVTRREFGKSTESAVPSDYDGDGIADLAVVGPNDLNQLVWRLSLSSQSFAVTENTFGQLGGTVLSGCSFDGDSKADRAIFFSDRYLSVERSSDSAVVTLDLATSGIERISCGDISGDGIVDIVAQTGGQSGASFYGWDFATQMRIFEKQLSRKASALIVADIDGDLISEVGYVEKKGSTSRAITFFKGADTVKVLLPKFVRAAVLRTSSAAGSADGLLLKGSRDDTYFKVSSLLAPTAYETILLNDTQTVLPGVNFVSPGPQYSKEASCQINHEPADGLNGFLWKPVSDTNGRAVVLLPNELRLKKVKLVKDGQVIDSLIYGGNGNGGRDHWRSRLKASSLDSNVTVMGTRAGVVHCWLLSDPLQRVD